MNFYQKVKKVYDEISENYDKSVLSNKNFLLIYILALDYLFKNFKEKQRVLDIGCGTGLEAIPLSLKKIQVVAVDFSKGMISIIKEKKEKFNLKNLEIYNLAAHEIDKLIKIYGEESFDGAYSFFGPLNSEPNIIKFKKNLFKLLKKDGIFIPIVINRWNLYDFITGKPRKVEGIYKGVKFRFYTPLEFVKIFSEFKVEEICGLSIFLPHQNTKVKNFKILKFLFFIDRYIYKTFPFKYFGTDFLIKFKK